MSRSGSSQLTRYRKTAAPAVVDPHGVVRCDGSIDEGPFRFSTPQGARLLEGIGLLPKCQDFVLLGDEVYFIGYLFESHNTPTFNFLKT